MLLGLVLGNGSATTGADAVPPAPGGGSVRATSPKEDHVTDDRPSPWSTHAPTDPHPGWSAPPSYGGAPGAYGAGRPLEPYGPIAAPAYAGPPIEVTVAAPPAGGRGLAVTGVVLGGLALLGVLLLVVVVVVFTFVGFDDESGGGGYAGPMRGTIAPATGSALTGTELAAEVTRKVTDDGGEPEGITCPATAKVAQDVTTVCHGTDYGMDSAFVVFFEDAKGSYTLLEI